METRLQRADEYPVWKTIRLGVLPSADALRTALLATGCKIVDYSRVVDRMLDGVVVAAKPMDVELVRVTPVKLGLRDRASWDMIWRSAWELGFKRCLAEVGPQLRLQYPEQRGREWVLVGCEERFVSKDRTLVIPTVFAVVSELGWGGGLYLSSSAGDPPGFWEPTSQWVFCR